MRPAAESECGTVGVVETRDEGAISIVEEGVVKQPFVTETLRIRKPLGTERRTIEADVRKEDAGVEGAGDAEVRDHS